MGKSEFKAAAPKKTIPKTRHEHKDIVKSKKLALKKNYATIQEVVSLWEKLRPKSTPDEEKRVIVADIMKKIKGKLLELAANHTSSRILQFCAKYGTPENRKLILSEIKENVIELSKVKHGHFLVKKLISVSPKDDIPGLVRMFRGHVAELLRQPSGADVLVDLYDIASTAQRNIMCAELYGSNFALFDGNPDGAAAVFSLKQILDGASAARRRTVLLYMSKSLAPVMEKALLHPPMTHRLLRDFLECAPAVSIEDAVDTLSQTGEAVLKMVHTHEGAAVASMLVAYGSARDRKRIVRAMKGHVRSMAENEWGHTPLCAVLQHVDDTTLVNKTLGGEIRDLVSEAVSDPFMRQPLLQLLAPGCRRYFAPDKLAMLSPPERVIKGSSGRAVSDIDGGEGVDERAAFAKAVAAGKKRGFIIDLHAEEDAEDAAEDEDEDDELFPSLRPKTDKEKRKDRKKLKRQQLRKEQAVVGGDADEKSRSKKRKHVEEEQEEEEEEEKTDEESEDVEEEGEDEESEGEEEEDEGLDGVADDDDFLTPKENGAALKKKGAAAAAGSTGKQGRKGAAKGEEEQEDEEAPETLGERALGMSKKDPVQRRRELLSFGGSGEKSLAHAIASAAAEQAEELLKHRNGCDVLFEVLRGGEGGLLAELAPQGVKAAQDAVAAVIKKAAERREREEAAKKVVAAAKTPQKGGKKAAKKARKGEEEEKPAEEEIQPVVAAAEGELLLFDYYASRTLRRLIQITSSGAEEKAPEPKGKKQGGAKQQPQQPEAEKTPSPEAVASAEAAARVLTPLIEEMWSDAFSGRSALWVGSHAEKVLRAFGSCGVESVRKAAAGL